MDDTTLQMVGKMMCSECDAFLGKPHKDTCARAGHLVEQSEAMEKFTTVEHAEQEDPLLGIDLTAAELILRWLKTSPDSDEDDPRDLEKLREGLEEFVEAAKE